MVDTSLEIDERCTPTSCDDACGFAAQSVNGVELVLSYEPYAPATTKQRLTCLKAACRWGWKQHEMGDHNPAEKMVLPEVHNERQVYVTREEMLRIARDCRHHGNRREARAAVGLPHVTFHACSRRQKGQPRGWPKCLIPWRKGWEQFY